MKTMHSISLVRRLIPTPLAALVLAAFWHSAHPLWAKPRPPLPPLPERSSLYLRFNETNWWGDLRPVPLVFDNIQLVESWSGYALHAGAKQANRLQYPIVAVDEKTGHARTNLNLAVGSLRFWFSPDWTSASLGGTGPVVFGRLVEVGAWTQDASYGWWSLAVAEDGDTLFFSAQAGGQEADYLKAPIHWQAGAWHLLTLTFDPAVSRVYVDGELAAEGEGVTLWPDAKVQAEHGFAIGNDIAGQASAGGTFDEFTTFGFQLSAEEIAQYYGNTRPLADLGPISETEEQARLAWLGGLREAAAVLKEAALAEGGGAMMSMAGYGTNVYDPNLWLEVHSESNLVFVLLHNTTTHADYRLLSSTNLPSTNWSLVTQVVGSEGQTELTMTNDKPTLFLRAVELPHAPSIQFSGGGATNWTTYTLGSGAKLIDTNVLVTDFDSPDFNGGRLTLTLTTNAQSEDLLAIRSLGTGTGQIGLTNSSVTYSGSLIGTWSGGSGSTPLVVNLTNSPATNALIAVLRNITFRYSATNPVLFERRLEFQLTDGDGETNAPTFKAIRVVCPQAIDTMLVIDVSQSLTETNFYRAKEAASNFVAHLDFASDRAGVVSFAGTISLDQALTTNGPLVGSTIMNLTTNSGTYFHDAINLAQAQFANTPTNVLPVILLMTDGLISTNVAANSNQAIQAAADAQAAGTRVIVLGYWGISGVNSNLLKQIASSTNDYHYAPTVDEMTNLFAGISHSLCRTIPLPTVSLTSPTNFAVFLSPANITLAATAAEENGAILRVEFYAGETQLGEDTNSPYSYTWSSVAAGQYSVWARAIDYIGLTATSAVAQVLVTNSTPPSVSLNNPTNGATFAPPATITLTAQASDQDGSVSKVEFYSGTNNLGQKTNTPYTLALQNVAMGNYTVFAVATDNSGLKGTSAPVSFTVTREFSRTFTLDADFDAGTLLNVNHDTPTNNQLQLNTRVTPFPFVNVACSARDTIVRIDANSGEVLGEYRTAPYGTTWVGGPVGPYPSRTTVDKYGNVWVANRNESGPVNGTNMGSVTRFGLVIGGTRVRKNPDASLTKDFNGEYLQPPFYYNTCIDRDGDGLIRTSRGLGDILSWSNNVTDLDGTNDTFGTRLWTNGTNVILLRGVASAEDEAIINYVRVAGLGTRTIAIDANNDVWVGGRENGYHEKLNGVTGLPVAGTRFRLPNMDTNYHAGGYGGLVDPNGVLWSARGLGAPYSEFDHHLLRYDPATQPPVDLGYYGGGTYGLGIDPKTGHVWMTGGGNGKVWHLKTNGAGVVSNTLPSGSLKGIAVDDSGNVWCAGEDVGKVFHLRTTNIALVGEVDLPCGGYPSGVAVDANGKVWVTCWATHNVLRIDPTQGPLTNGYRLGAVDLTVNLGEDAEPYNYSDMTGFIVMGTTAHAGNWFVVHDSEQADSRWLALTWSNTTPAGTSMRVDARAAETIVGLATAAFQGVTNAVPVGTNMLGRYIELRASFTAGFGVTNIPTLYDLTVTWTNASSAVTSSPFLHATNHLLQAVFDTVTVFRNTATNRLNVLTNDTDLDGDALFIAGYSAPQHGLVELPPDGQRLLYTPDPQFSGDDTLTYTVADGYGGVSRATVKITVSRAGPGLTTTASNDTFVVEANASSAYLLDVLANDTEPNGGPLTIITNTAPTHGSVVNTNFTCGCNLYYQPNQGFVGVDTFAYTIQATNGSTGTATVTVSVVEAPVANRAPQAKADTFLIEMNSSANPLTVLTNDTDPDGDALSLVTNTPAAHGTLQRSGNSLLYTPQTNYVGPDGFRYWVTDGRESVASASVQITVQTNAGFAARDDFSNTQPYPSWNSIDVLANDLGTGLHIASLTSITNGATVSVVTGAVEYLQYWPAQNFQGRDSFSYTLTDANGHQAAATVCVFVGPTQNYPNIGYDTYRIPSNSQTNRFDVLANDTGSGLVIVSFTYPQHGTLVPCPTNATSPTYFLYTPDPTFTNYWTNYDSFTYVISNAAGFCCEPVWGDQVAIEVTNVVSQFPIAVLFSPTNDIDYSLGTPQLAIPIMLTGSSNIIGTAYDPDPTDAFSYELALYTLEGQAVAYMAGQSRITNGVLGAFDFTTVQNGSYDLRLIVYGGYQTATAQVRVSVGNQIKIGQFSFSEQDLVIPVSGIPLTVIRTYNSFNPNKGDFGYSWTYSLIDMDVQLDEERAEAIDVATDEVFSLRSGGGRNVALTLPDGRRTSFAFTLVEGASDDWGVPCFCYWPVWVPAPGVYASLEANGNLNSLTALGGYPPYWADGDARTPEWAYDFPGFTLTTPEGTRYVIDREYLGSYDLIDEEGEYVPVLTYGKGRLSSIEQRSGDRIVLTNDYIAHYNPTGALTRYVSLHRDDQGRIDAIYDPIGGTNGWPAVQYQYDTTNGNLTAVLKLVNRTTGAYLTNRYFYTNIAFPHYITSIQDARDKTPLRTLYDDQGRLIGTIDAYGYTNRVVHNLTNRTETIFDRAGNPTVHGYDDRGNITYTIDALNAVTQRGYDTNNNLLWEADPLTNFTFYGYDGRGNRTAVTNALGHFSQYIYSTNNELLITIDANGHGTTNSYDSHGQLTSTVDALGNPTTYLYNTRGLLISQSDALGTVTTNEYDSLGNLTSVTVSNLQSGILSRREFTHDANGNQITETTYPTVNGVRQATTTTNVFDAQGRVVVTFDSAGYSNRTVYNPIGKPEVAIDKLNRTNRYDYSDRGKLARLTFPDGTSEGYAYDVDGRRTFSTNRLGRVTQSVFDAVGRLTQTIQPDNTTNTTVYDAAGRVIGTIDARGFATTFGYDEVGRRTGVTNALNQRTFSQLDPVGNLGATMDALNHRTDQVFDALNRRVTTIFPATEMFGARSTNATGYDSLGRRVAETNEAGIVTRLAYDDLSMLLAVTNGWGTSVSNWAAYLYDERAHQTNQMDALGRNSRFEVDKLGRRSKRRLPGGQEETSGYDAVGNLVAHTNFDGTVTTNAYDSMNRLVKKATLAGVVLATYAYSASGMLTQRVDEAGTFTWVYDNRGRARTNTTPNGAIYFDYDANGNLTHMWTSTPNGVDVAYQYDALNRLTNTLDNGLTGNQHTHYGYDAVGNLAWLRYPNGVTNQYQYDSRNRLTNIVWKLGTNTLTSFAYQLAVAGNRTNLSEVLDGTTRNYGWSYDPLYRLTNETISTHGTLGYRYDALGNRTNRASTVSVLTNQNFTFNSNDWLTIDAYDPNGNTTNSADVAYRYDWANRLTNANNGSVSIVYDADGNRLRKVAGGTTTLYLVSAINPSGYAQVVEELTVSAGTTNLTKAFTYGLHLITQRVPNSSTNFFATDGLGSTRLLLNTAGSVANAFAYDAYGTLIASNGAPQTDYLFAGEPRDVSLGGIYYLRTRYNNPGTGRFLTADTFGGYQTDPQSLHRYTYAANNPVNMLDPTGQNAVTYDVLFASTLSMSIRATWEQHRAPIYVAATLAAVTVAGITAYSAATEWMPIQDAKTALEEAGTSVREEIAKAQHIWRTRVNNLRIPKVVPMPMSVIPDVANNVAVGQLSNPGPLTRANLIRTARNRYYATKGRGPAGPGMSWDEYPFASTLQGGTPAVVRPVPEEQNWIQGGIIAAAYAMEKINVGDSFVVIVTP